MWIPIEILDYAHKISQNNGKWNAPQGTERSAGLRCILLFNVGE